MEFGCGVLSWTNLQLNTLRSSQYTYICAWGTGWTKLAQDFYVADYHVCMKLALFDANCDVPVSREASENGSKTSDFIFH